MNSIFIHFNVTAALFFFRDSNKGLFVDNCFMMIGKQILRNEAKDYLHEMGRQRDREKSLDALTQQELDKLSTVDQYPSDSYIFSSHGYDLLINNELVAEAFASLPEQEQSILILHCVLEMADGEIGSLMGMSRSAVQRHRTSTLKQLRVKLMALMPGGR